MAFKCLKFYLNRDFVIKPVVLPVMSRHLARLLHQHIGRIVLICLYVWLATVCYSKVGCIILFPVKVAWC